MVYHLVLSSIISKKKNKAPPPNPFLGGIYYGQFFFLDARIYVSWDYIEKV